MPRLAATSDLHFDSTGMLTTPAKVYRIARQAKRSGADAIVLAGDLGHPLKNFSGCLDAFIGAHAPVGVVAGNHDVWRDEVHSSQALWDNVLPIVSRQRGLHWLERDTMRVGDVAIVGSMVWYDYSAAEECLGLDPAYYASVKPRITNDALWVDWPWSDAEVADDLRERLVENLEECQRDRSISKVVVVTHVPVFEQQMLRNPNNFAWSVANAYFGNLRTGREIARFSKVHAVISGHLHTSIESTVPRSGMPDLRTYVIGSDYGEPVWVLIDV
jgi:3',5'-cyclic AMP phosphodiesterase CpdA